MIKKLSIFQLIFCHNKPLNRKNWENFCNYGKLPYITDKISKNFRKFMEISELNFELFIISY